MNPVFLDGFALLALHVLNESVVAPLADVRVQMQTVEAQLLVQIFLLFEGVLQTVDSKLGVELVYRVASIPFVFCEHAHEILPTKHCHGLSPEPVHEEVGALLVLNVVDHVVLLHLSAADGLEAEVVNFILLFTVIEGEPAFDFASGWDA